MDIVKQVSENLRQGLAQYGGGSKVFKRFEMEQKRLQRLREEERREAEAKALREKQLLQQQRYYNCTHHKPSKSASSSASNELKLPQEEVIRRLRILKHPVTLFGEDDGGRLARLKFVLEAGLFEVDDISEGQRNDFLRHIVELKKSGAGRKRTRKATDDEEDLKRMKANFEELCDEDKILVFFKKLLSEWNQQLDEMSPKADKRLTAKENATVATIMQCASDLNPLFNLCRKKLLAGDITRALLGMVECCMKRDYEAANDHYVNKIAIGNAPWPIGVTMIGIHERSAREKIHTSNVSVAHIMNDESTRKYLHSVKRLVSFCKERYP